MNHDLLNLVEHRTGRKSPSNRIAVVIGATIGFWVNWAVKIVVGTTFVVLTARHLGVEL